MFNVHIQSRTGNVRDGGGGGEDRLHWRVHLFYLTFSVFTGYLFNVHSSSTHFAQVDQCSHYFS